LNWLELNEELAEKVASAGKIAVELDPKSSSNRDTYGVILALKGNTKEATEHFKFYINDPRKPRNRRKRREEWIKALEGGENPFDPVTPELIESLKTE
jgi:hypothetical protein